MIKIYDRKEVLQNCRDKNALNIIFSKEESDEIKQIKLKINRMRSSNADLINKIGIENTFKAEKELELYEKSIF